MTMVKLETWKVHEFLKTDVNKLKVVEISDGEITLETEEGYVITLYLNHKLNETQGFPRSFLIRRIW